MLVTAKVTIDVDPKKYREEYDCTSTETAAKVREDIQEFADYAVKNQFYKVLGIGRDEAQNAFLAEHPDQSPMSTPND